MKNLKTFEQFVTDKLMEGAMSDIHLMAKNSKTIENFIKAFYKKYDNKVKKGKSTDEWIISLYNDMESKT